MQKTLSIDQVDYEKALYYEPGDPLPHIDFSQVDWQRIVAKEHRTIVLESEYLTTTILPEMGRVYSMVYRPTGHETLWRNDIVRPGGANNETGWWLWIGGIEYTLPKDEHGTTWALPWQWQILEDSDRRKAVRLQVEEPTTRLRQRIDLSVAAGSAALEADIRIWNPTADTVEFAHWVNPMWAPGGGNELTDSTEFIIPTRRVLIEERWQQNLGPSPQLWDGNPLRYIRNWSKMGDLMADGLEAGFYGVYAHEAEEGVVRVFDPLINPGVDMWTYGFRPRDIPMGSGAPNKGYVEMWGGTVETFPHQTKPLAPGGQLGWTEWIYPYQQTGGISQANGDAVVKAILEEGKVEIDLCPSRALQNASFEVREDGRTLVRRRLAAAPDAPFNTVVELASVPVAGEVLLIIYEGEVELLRVRL